MEACRWEGRRRTDFRVYGFQQGFKQDGFMSGSGQAGRGAVPEGGRPVSGSPAAESADKGLSGGTPPSAGLHWYAAYTRPNREFAVRERLESLGVECFLPTEEIVRETPFGRKKAVAPLIYGMIFIRTDKATSFSLINDHFLRIVYLKDPESRHSLVIPDKQMSDFRFVLDVAGSGVEVLNKDLRAGDRVRVVKGPLAGLEGELIRVRGHKRVVIRIDGVASIATSYIPGSHLERINKGQCKEA